MSSSGELQPFADEFGQQGPASRIDVSQVRRETRGCKLPGAGESPIHFNNAGAALMPSVVVDACVEYIKQEEDLGGYEVAGKRSEDIERFYTASAKLLHCQPEEVAFVESATRGWHLAFYSLPFTPGDRIITSAMDYGSNFVAYLQAREKHGAEIVVVPDDEQGQMDLALLADELKHPRARVVSVSHIPTGGGVVNPAEKIGAIAKAAGVPYVLDACQSVGQMPIDVEALQCDVLTATGRKYLRGPRGTGLLYVRKAFQAHLHPCMLDQYGALLTSETQYTVRPDARRFEMWESNLAGKVGLTAAIEYALSLGLAPIYDRVQHLSAQLRDGLGSIDGVVPTDCGPHKCGIVTFVVRDLEAAEVQAYLAQRGISISISAASSGGSRVWFDRRGLSEVLRASLHYYNTEEEVRRFLATLRTLAATLRPSGAGGPEG